MFSEYHSVTSISLSLLFLVDLLAGLRSGDDNDRPRTSSGQNGSMVLNINDLPLPSETDNTAIFQSAVFIEDGIKYRSIHHKIDPTSLKVYRIYYSRYIQWTIGIVLFLNLILAFFEYPTSITLSSDFKFRDNTWRFPDPPCGITESIELACLLFLLGDCITKFYLLGLRRFIQRRWLLLYSVMLVLSFIDLGVSLTFCGIGQTTSLGYTLRIRRFFRPLFFLLHSSIMKKFTKAAIFTLPQIFSVLFLLVLHLYVFTMIGLLVFPRSPQKIPLGPSSNNSNMSMDLNFTDLTNSSYDDSTNSSELPYLYYSQLEGDKYFPSVFDSIISLLVLLTTANHPDIMMPIYQYNRFSALYFILFLSIGAFLILNLVIAATYNQFKGYFQKSLQSSFFRRRVAFRAAFTILARKTYQMQQRTSSRLSYTQEVVSKHFIRGLLQRAKINGKIVPLMYPAMETTNSDSLTWPQFKDVFDLVSSDTTKKHHTRLDYYTQIQAFQWFQLFIRHKYFAYFTYFVSLLNVTLITVELELSYETALGNQKSRLAYYNLCFIVYYTLEQILKLIGFGVKGYVRSIGNIYEGVVTIILVILEILTLCLYYTSITLSHPEQAHDILIRLMNIFIVLRLLRILAHVKSLRLLTSIIMDLIGNLKGFAGIIVVIYYLFALLGMELFANVDGPTSNDSISDCGSYDNLNYYANNFHDFASTLVILWDIMVVNNWFVFLDKFASDSILGGWSKLYFIVWWLIAAIMCVNLFVSLVLETFLVRWDVVHARAEREERGQGGELDEDMYGGESAQVRTHTLPLSN